MKARKHLWLVEGVNLMRQKVGEYFWAYSAYEAKERWAKQFGGVPSRCEYIR